MEQTISHRVASARGTAPFQPVFKLFIACEDQATFSQARKVEELVESLCGKGIETSRVFWNFALLRHELLREHAVAEAAEADMIVLSYRANGELPGHVKNFLESLPVRPQAGQAALVTLIGPDRKSAAELHPQVSYLRRLGENLGLNFFCNQERWNPVNFLQPVKSRFEERALGWENLIASQVPWSAGGIND